MYIPQIPTLKIIKPPKNNIKIIKLGHPALNGRIKYIITTIKEMINDSKDKMKPNPAIIINNLSD